jgi:hypothetical protein
LSSCTRWNLLVFCAPAAAPALQTTLAPTNAQSNRVMFLVMLVLPLSKVLMFSNRVCGDAVARDFRVIAERLAVFFFD